MLPVMAWRYISGRIGRGDMATGTCGGNSANSFGGAIFNYTSGPILTNCTFSANSAANGVAITCDSGEHHLHRTLKLTNSILWDGGNEIWKNDTSIIDVTYTNIQGGFPGEGNIDVDPLFANPGYCRNPSDPEAARRARNLTYVVLLALLLIAAVIVFTYGPFSRNKAESIENGPSPDVNMDVNVAQVNETTALLPLSDRRLSRA